MTTLPRPRFWCLRYQTCGYSGESLAELVEHRKVERLAAWEAFREPGRGDKPPMVGTNGRKDGDEMTILTLEEVQGRIAGLDEERQKGVVCALIGHSHITSVFWGQHSCGRCGALLGDSLAGAYKGAKDVVIGHDCETCHSNYSALDWRDKFLVPDPFLQQEETK